MLKFASFSIFEISCDNNFSVHSCSFLYTLSAKFLIFNSVSPTPLKIPRVLQVEETKVESIKRDKAATEKLLQETIEKNQAELAAQKEFYTNALNAAKEAEALAESRANNEARIELERRLREADERESMLVQSLEELRQTLSRTEQQVHYF